MANPMGKTRPKDNPYLIYESADGSWKWLVLKAYASDPNKSYARWYCVVTSPFTSGLGDLGDCYISDVVLNATLTYMDESLPTTVVPIRELLQKPVFPW